MPDPNKGANTGDDGVNPSASPTVDQPETPTPVTPETPAAPENVTTEVPFHQRPDIKETIDYIGRQVLKSVEEKLGVHNPRQPEETPITLDMRAQIEARAEVFAKKHGVDKAVAMDMMLENRQLLDSEFKNLNQKVESFDLVFKFNALFNEVPDAKNYSKEMGMLLDNMNPRDRKYILESPTGTQFLYFQAKQSRGNTTPRPAAPSTSSRSPSPALKMGSIDVQVNSVLEAFKKKDPKAFQEAVQSISRK